MSDLSDAELATCKMIEKTLADKKAYKKVNDRIYVLQQGSTYIVVQVIPWGTSRAVVRCVAQLVRGVKMNEDLAMQLLKMNGVLRFGSFAFMPKDSMVVFLHSILGGETLDSDELWTTLVDVAIVADEWDDQVQAVGGGTRLTQPLDGQAITHLLAATPETYPWQAAPQIERTVEISRSDLE